MTPTKIIADVCADRGVAIGDILGKCRKREVVIARAVIAQRLSACGFSSQQIGRWLNKDHTLILWYLGGKRSGQARFDIRLKWRAPKVRHLCFIKPPKPKPPKKLYLIPYVGADFHGISEPRYQWKERPPREVAA